MVEVVAVRAAAAVVPFSVAQQRSPLLWQVRQLRGVLFRLMAASSLLPLEGLPESEQAVLRLALTAAKSVLVATEGDGIEH